MAKMKRGYHAVFSHLFSRERENGNDTRDPSIADLTPRTQGTSLPAISASPAGYLLR